MAGANRYKYLISNTLLLLISNISTRLISFIFLPLYTSYLTQAAYGSIDLTNTAVNLLLPVFTLNIYDAVLRFALDRTEDKSHVFTVGITITFIGCLVLLPFLPLLKLQNGLQDYVGYVYLIFVGQAFYTLLSNFARAIDKVRLMAGVSILGSLANFILNYYFVAIAKMGIMGYFYGMIAGNTIMIALLFIGCRGHRFIATKFNYAVTFRRMFMYSGPLIPNSVIWWANNSISKLFLANISLDIQGLYAAASKLPAILNIFVTIFQQAWNLSAFKEIDTEDGEAFFNKVFRLFNSFILGGALLIIVASEWLAVPLFKGEFYEAWHIVPLLILGSYFNAVSSFIGSVFTAKKQTRSLFTSTFFSAVVNVGATIIMVPIWGAYGAAIATLICYIFLWLSRLYSSRKYIRLKFNKLKMLLSQLTLLGATIASMNRWYLILVIAAIVMFVLNYHSYKAVISKILRRKTADK